MKEQQEQNQLSKTLYTVMEENYQLKRKIATLEYSKEDQEYLWDEMLHRIAGFQYPQDYKTAMETLKEYYSIQRNKIITIKDE